MWPFKGRPAGPGPEDGSVKLNDILLTALLSPDEMDLDKAMNIPAFAGCVNRICGTAAIIPIRLYRRDGVSVEAVKDDPRVALLNEDTGDTLSGADFKKAMVFDYLTNKGGYAYINHRGRRWHSLHYVSADNVAFMENTDPIFKDYEIIVNAKRYRPYQFIKFLRKTMDGYKGRPVIDENRTLLAAAYNALLLENSLMKNGGNKKGYLLSEKPLTQEAINALKEGYRKLYSNASDNIVVLNNGIKFQEASETSVEMQLNENKQQNSVEICKIFGVPPAILGGGATAQDWTAYIQYCILPIFTVFTTALNRDLLLEREKGCYYFAPDVAELVRADIQTRYDAYSTALKSGWIQVNEVRRQENLPDIDMSFIKLGLQDVLLDPETGSVYTPNTGKWGSVRDQSAGLEQDEEQQEQEGEKDENNDTGR